MISAGRASIAQVVVLAWLAALQLCRATHHINVFANSSASLSTALQNNTNSVVGIVGYVVLEAADFSPGAVILNRSVTITGAPGTNAILDLSDVSARLSLCSSAILKLASFSIVAGIESGQSLHSSALQQSLLWPFLSLSRGARQEL